MPIETPTDVFGFHPNADITKNMNETLLMTDSLLSCSSAGGGSGKRSQGDVINELCDKILSDFPLEYPINEIMEKYPVDYH